MTNRKKVRLTSRDLEAVKWIAEQQAVRLDTVGRLLHQRNQGLDDRALRRLAERWELAGLVNRRRILATAPSILWPTAEGLRCAEIVLRPGQRPPNPSVGTLLHTLAAAEIRLTYERFGWHWIAERLLPMEGKTIHRPDAVVELDKQRGLVEVERAQKSHSRLLDILRTNLRTPAVHFVDYWVTPEVRPVVTATASHLEPELASRLRIFDIPEVVR